MMTHQEIIDFFKQRGAIGEFKIVDSPLFTHMYIEKNAVLSQTLRIGDASITSVDDFIQTRVNIPNKYMYIYAGQDFSDNMKYMRYTAIPKDIMEVRRFKLNRLKEKMTNNLK